MLRIAASAALDADESRVERLVALWGDAWHLVHTADDILHYKCVETIRRDLAAQVQAGHPAPTVWGINKNLGQRASKNDQGHDLLGRALYWVP